MWYQKPDTKSKSDSFFSLDTDPKERLRVNDSPEENQENVHVNAKAKKTAHKTKLAPPTESEIFAHLFNKDSSDIELFLDTFNALAQKKSQLNELLKSLSSIKSDHSVESLENVVREDKEDKENSGETSSSKTADIERMPPLTDVSPNKNQETLAELSNQVWHVLLTQMEANENDLGGYRESSKKSNVKSTSTKKYSKSNRNNNSEYSKLVFFNP